MAGMYDIDKQYFIGILFFLSSSSLEPWKEGQRDGGGGGHNILEKGAL